MLVRSVHKTTDLTSNLFCRVGVRFDGLDSQFVTSDDAADLRELNTVLFGNFEDDLGKGDITALTNDRGGQIPRLDVKVGNAETAQHFGGTLAEKGNLTKDGILLLGLFHCLLGLQPHFQLLNSLIFEVKTLGIVCIVGDDILVGVCVLRRNAGSLNRAVKRDNLEIIGRKFPETVVYHVVADCITVVLLLLDRLAQDKIELFDDFDDAVGFKLIPGGRTTGFEYINLPGVTGKSFAFGVLAAGLGQKGKMAEIFQCEPKVSVEKLIRHKRDFGGDTFLVDDVQDVDKSGANSLFHEWNLPSGSF